MKLELDIQLATEYKDLPDSSKVKTWICAALSHANFQLPSPSITLRIVSLEESQQLNADFRSKDNPTNVLSFPFEAPEGIKIAEMEQYLGDIAICAKLVEQEANKQLKLVESHWAHLVIHGVLHLLGFDHNDEEQATEMETLEIAILASVGISNPYIIN